MCRRWRLTRVTFLSVQGRSAIRKAKRTGVYALLARKLGDLGQYDNPRRIKRGITPCLGVCHSGPILVVYPEGIWYCQVDEALLDRIVEEHLRNGRPVEEAVYLRLQ